MPLDASAKAFLRDLLAEPLASEEEEHHTRAAGRDVGFDNANTATVFSRWPLFFDGLEECHSVF